MIVDAAPQADAHVVDMRPCKQQVQGFRGGGIAVVHIDKTCNNMAVQFGERPTDMLLGDFHPSMDSSSITELVHYRIGEGASARAEMHKCTITNR